MTTSSAVLLDGTTSLEDPARAFEASRNRRGGRRRASSGSGHLGLVIAALLAVVGDVLLAFRLGGGSLVGSSRRIDVLEEGVMEPVAVLDGSLARIERNRRARSAEGDEVGRH